MAISINTNDLLNRTKNLGSAKIEKEEKTRIQEEKSAPDG